MKNIYVQPCCTQIKNKKRNKISLFKKKSTFLFILLCITLATHSVHAATPLNAQTATLIGQGTGISSAWTTMTLAALTAGLLHNSGVITHLLLSTLVTTYIIGVGAIVPKIAGALAKACAHVDDHDANNKPLTPQEIEKELYEVDMLAHDAALSTYMTYSAGFGALAATLIFSTIVVGETYKRCFINNPATSLRISPDVKGKI